MSGFQEKVFVSKRDVSRSDPSSRQTTMQACAHIFLHTSYFRYIDMYRWKLKLKWFKSDDWWFNRIWQRRIKAQAEAGTETAIEIKIRAEAKVNWDHAWGVKKVRGPNPDLGTQSTQVNEFHFIYEYTLQSSQWARRNGSSNCRRRSARHQKLGQCTPSLSRLRLRHSRYAPDPSGFCLICQWAKCHMDLCMANEMGVHSEKTVLPEFRLDFWSIIGHWVADVHTKSLPWLPAFKTHVSFLKSANMLWTKYIWLYFLPLGMISSWISFFASEHSIDILSEIEMVHDCWLMIEWNSMERNQNRNRSRNKSINEDQSIRKSSLKRQRSNINRNEWALWI
jgi:hypothetical protein